MASNVNIKFVAILASSLLLLATLVAGAAYVSLKKSPEDLVKEGDQLMAAGEFEDATKSYSKAVNKDQTNVAYLIKWQEALVNTIPETYLEYSQSYNEDYIGILRRLAVLQISDPQAQRDMIDAAYAQTQFNRADAQNWTSFINSCNDSYENLDMTDPAARSLLRYRGFARVALMPIVATTQEEHDQAVDDLTAAFDADPTDIDALLALSSLYRLDWIQALAINRPAVIAETMGNLKATIEKLREHFPDDPRALARILDFDIESKIRLDSSLAGQIRIRKQLRGIEEPLIETFLSCDTDLLDADLLERTFSYGRAVWNLRPDDYNDLGLQVTERVLESRPDDFALQFFHGIQLSLAGRYEDAHDAFQICIDMPDLPVSLDGLRLKGYRSRAVFQQANSAMANLARSETEQDRQTLLTKINDLATTLENDLGEDSPMTLMVNAKLAMAEQRNSDAVSLLQRLSTTTGNTNIEVIRLLARALAAQGTYGAALDQYERWMEINDVDPQPLLEAAQIDLKLRNPEQAIVRLQTALSILPDSEEIKRQLDTLLISTGSGGDSVARDPVIAEMMRAEAIANSGQENLPEAIAILALVSEEHPNDARPLAMYVEYLARSGDTEGALAVAQRGLDLLPGNETFNKYVAALSTGDRTQIALEYIDKGNDPEAVKLIKKYALMKQLGEEERSMSFLNDAVSRFPTHPSVLDAQFVRALQSDDMAKAREIANAAAKANADQADGLLYQARINLKEDDLSSALNNLELAVEKAALSPQAWRLYGQVLLRQGRTEEGVEALAKASNYKPDDVEISKIYASALIQLRRFETALEVIRMARRFTTSDDAINEMWLALESKSGDADLAIEHRFSRHRSKPDDVVNTRSLITLLTEQERFDEAGALIQDSIDAGISDLTLTVIQARWYADQGRIDEALVLFETYISKIDPAELDETPFLALGNFLINRGQMDAGIDAFRRGAKHQSMDMMSADRRIGDYYFSGRKYEQALESYRKVTTAGADESGIVSKRIIETLQRLERWDEAEKELDKLTAGAEEDIQTVLLRADIAAGRGDLRGARELVNSAVDMAPNKPAPFIRRAQLEFDDSERLSFVLSDLAQAIRLDPTSIQPRIMRTRALQQNKRSAEAIAELRRGIEAVPDSSELRRMLIQELWSSGRHDEAHAAARQAIEANDQNPVWLMVAGDIASRDSKLKNNWAVARGFFDRAYEIDRSYMIALRLANACLFLDPPDWKAALETIDSQGDLQNTDSQLLILKARAVNISGDHDQAVKLAERSIAAASNVDELRHWFLHMEELFDQQDEMIAFVDRNKSPEKLMPAYIVHASVFQAFDPSRRPQILKSLHESEQDVIRFAEEDGNAATLVSLYRVLGQLEYGQGNYETAEAAFAKGVDILPNDMEFNNNLAYTRAKYLNDLEGALTPAERAVELSPANSAALDTLGWIYYRLGRYGQAKQKIARAMDNAETPIERGGAFLHMAQVLLAEGDRPEARKYAELARDIIKNNRYLGPEFDADFKALMTELQEAENTR